MSMSLTPSSHNRPGRLIVLCGLDGTGKSTACAAVAARLAKGGIDVVETGQPTKLLRDMPLFQRYRYEPENRGTMIDHRAVICLFLADRLQHAHEMILPALDRGQWVVCHRYYYNLIAEARAIDLHDSWITHGCDALPQPDSAVILDADLDTIVQRISARTDPRSGFVDRRPHLEHVLEEYRRLARELAIPIVSSSKLSADEMVEQVWSIVCGCIARTV